MPLLFLSFFLSPSVSSFPFVFFTLNLSLSLFCFLPCSQSPSLVHHLSLSFWLPLTIKVEQCDSKQRRDTKRRCDRKQETHVLCYPFPAICFPLLPSPYWHTRICLCLALAASAFLTFLSACHICPTQPDWMKQGQEHAWKEKRGKQNEREREKWLQCFCQQWAAGVPSPQILLNNRRLHLL